MRRGPYFKYLKDDSKPIPLTTQRSREQLQPNLDYRENVEGERQFNPALEEQFNNDMVDLPAENMEVEDQTDDEGSNDEYNDQFGIEEAASEDEENIEMHPRQLDEHLQDDEEGGVEERKTIYRGCSLTKDESDLLIMSFLIRHGITDVGLEDLLELLNCHLPMPYLSPSKYIFLKRFPSVANVDTFFHCPKCSLFLNFHRATSTVCDSCDIRYYEADVKRAGNFFLHIPLKEQLRKLLSGPLFHKLKRNCDEPDGVISDVNSGSLYRTLKSKEHIGNLDITIQWNTDGVDTFKSSKASMWPIQVAINELPYRLRNQNIILSSIWCATTKPILDLYLRPFVEELKELHETGLECLPPGFEEPVNIKVHTILAPVDSVARCALQNIHQFNGEFGCSMCLNPGEHVRVGKGFARVYCGTANPPRTIGQHKRDAEQAVNEMKVVNGVKGVSLLMLLPALFNIILSFPPEYMHSVLLGVVRMFVQAWFNPSNCDCAWYLNAEKKARLDERLKEIRPPSEITRTPRSINDIKLWKASELKSFLLYYSLPCLKDLLPSPYYKHWSLLVFAIHKLLAEKINDGDLAMADEAIQNFVQDTETLYGKEFMKFNVHLLLHIPKSVRYFGALWAWSAFGFESYNYVLRSMLHSTQSVMQQVCKSYLRFQGIKFNTTFLKRNCSAAGKNLFLKLMGENAGKCRQIMYDDNDNRLKIFGSGNVRKLNLVEKLAIQAVINGDIENHAQSYQRFMYRRIMYHSSLHERMYKRDNGVMRTNSGTFMTITAIVSVTTVIGTKKFVVLGKSIELLGETLCRNRNISSSSYSYVGQLVTDNTTACFPGDITNKCILISGDERKDYIIPLVNTVETD